MASPDLETRIFWDSGEPEPLPPRELYIEAFFALVHNINEPGILCEEQSGPSITHDKSSCDFCIDVDRNTFPTAEDAVGALADRLEATAHAIRKLLR